MEKINLDKSNLRKFGITMSACFLAIALLILLRKKYILFPLIVFSSAFYISAFVMPVILKPIYIFWMKLAFVLGWINTRLILFILFYLVFTPIGLVIKLFGMDLLDRKIDKNKQSYWRKKEAITHDYKRQF